MARATVRLLSLALSMVAVHASVCEAQDVQWGLKGGVNSSSVSAVVDYYGWLLCCDPRVPGTRIESSRGAGLTAGGFVAFPVHTWFGVQSDVLLSRRRHSVDLRPYEAIQATFTRDHVEISGLAKLEFVAAGANHVYFGGGPVIGFRVGEDTESSDPRLRRGDPETDIAIVAGFRF